MQAYPRLLIDQLALGQPQLSDVPQVIAYAGNKKIADGVLQLPRPYEEKDAVSWLHTGQHYIFIVI